MPKTLKIIGPTDVHGRKPGEEFEIETDADGIPTDVLWRKRLSDEAKFKPGIVSVVTAAPPAKPSSTASTSSTSTKESK